MRSLPNRRRLCRALARWSLTALIMCSIGGTALPGAVSAQTASTAPVAGEIVVQPKAGVALSTLSAKYGTSTLFQFIQLTRCESAFSKFTPLIHVFLVAARQGSVDCIHN